jgi:hypothetical protein
MLPDLLNPLIQRQKVVSAEPQANVCRRRLNTEHFPPVENCAIHHPPQ